MYSPFYELENNMYIPSEIQQTYSDRLINLSSIDIILEYVNKLLGNKD